MTKADEYKHPKWQAMRLKTLERYGFKCAVCDSTEKTLHVHHRRYHKGKKIWECEDCDLTVLCEDCHKEAEEFVSFAREVGYYILRCFKHIESPFSPEELLRMFTDYAAHQMDANAEMVFGVAIKTIEVSKAISDSKKEDEEECE